MALRPRLDSRALSVSKAAREGRYVALDAAKTLAKFMRNGQPDPDVFVAAIGPVLSRAAAAAHSQNARVVAFGEMVALLWAESLRMAVDVHEAGAHGVVQKSQAARDLIVAVERLLASGTFFGGEPND